MSVPPSILSYVSAGPAAAPLNPDQLRIITAAQSRLKKIRAAARLARLDAFTLAFFGVITLVTSYTSPPAILLSLVLISAGIYEWINAAALDRLAPRSARNLMLNQLALGSGLILYALYYILFPAAISPELRNSKKDFETLGMDIDQINNEINSLLYYGLILIAFAAQGSMALYYFRRQRMVKALQTETPPWALEIALTLT